MVTMLFKVAVIVVVLSSVNAVDVTTVQPPVDKSEKSHTVNMVKETTQTLVNTADVTTQNSGEKISDVEAKPKDTNKVSVNTAGSKVETHGYSVDVIEKAMDTNANVVYLKETSTESSTTQKSIEETSTPILTTLKSVKEKLTTEKSINTEEKSTPGPIDSVGKQTASSQQTVNTGEKPAEPLRNTENTVENLAATSQQMVNTVEKPAAPVRNTVNTVEKSTPTLTPIPTSKTTTTETFTDWRDMDEAESDELVSFVVSEIQKLKFEHRELDECQELNLSSVLSGKKMGGKIMKYSVTLKVQPQVKNTEACILQNSTSINLHPEICEADVTEGDDRGGTEGGKTLLRSTCLQVEELQD